MRAMRGGGVCAVGLLITVTALAQSPDITSFQGNGALAWTNSDTNLFYRIEWAASLTGPVVWHSNYLALMDLRSSDSFVTSPVPLFYRVCGSSNALVHPAPVLKTWQTNVYSASDDGSYQAGTAWSDSRFTEGTGASSNCVIDTMTGLMWVKNPDSTKRAWADALTYCEGLDGTSGRGGYDDWRLPNVRELQSLIDYGRKGPALPLGHPFLAIPWDTYYWTSTTYLDAPQYAWCVHFSNGYVFNGEPGKTGTYYVWPVRDGR